MSFQERAGKPGSGKGILIQDERVGALSTLNNQSVFGISSYDSNAMKSSNPNSGICKADTARTLDNNGGSPACNQGGMAIVCLNDQGGSVMNVSEEETATLRAQTHGHEPVVYDASRRHDYQPFGDVSETVQAAYGTGGNNTPMVVKGVDVYNGKITGNVTSPLTCNSNATSTQPIVLEDNGSRESHKGDGYKESETMYTLNMVEQHAVYDARGNGDGETVPTITGDHQNRVTDYTAITYGRDRSAFNQGQNAKFDFSIDKELIGPQLAKGPGAVAVDCRNGTEDEINGSLQASSYHNNNSNNVCRTSMVRRLTPMECERLQGFPDRWTDIGEWIDSKGKKHKDADSPRYKALGNSIALPFWFWLLRRISSTYTRRATLGSLFDGIGGFPFCWEMCNGKGTARWASEIEEFPIAVTKARFPENPDRGGQCYDPVISFTLGSYLATGNNVASTLMARDYKDMQSIVQKQKQVKETKQHDGIANSRIPVTGKNQV